MSTKIYEGFKFSTTDLKEIHKHLMDLREKIKPIHEKLYFEVLSRLSVFFVDRDSLGLNKDVENSCYPLIDAEFSIIERQKKVKATMQRDPIVDFEFEIAILPIEGKVLGIPYTEQKEFLDCLKSQPFYEEYGYWNNTDPLETVTEEEWEQRRKDWDDAIGYEPPSMCGFGASISNRYDTRPDLDVVLEKIKRTHSYGDRVYEWSRELASKVFYERKEKELDKSTVMEFYRSFGKWIKSEEGKEVLLEKEIEVKNKLYKEITKDLLLGKFPEGGDEK